MSTFTHFDSHEIRKREREMLEFLKNNVKKHSNLNPSKATVSNILQFSKALSIKKSSQMGFIESILN